MKLSRPFFQSLASWDVFTLYAPVPGIQSYSKVYLQSYLNDFLLFDLLKIGSDIIQYLYLKFTAIIMKNLFLSIPFLILIHSFSFSQSVHLSICKKEGKWGYMDEKSQEAIPSIFNYLKEPSEGTIPVALEGKWGFYDYKGRKLIDLKYENVHSFSEGLAAAKTNGKWGFIDRSGSTIIPSQFDSVGSFSNGRAAVHRNNKWGFINQKGNFAIPPRYNVAEKFSEGLALICTLKDYYVMKDGRVVKRKFGLIDREGNIVLDTIYDVIGNFVNGYARVRIDHKTGMIDNKGKLILKPEWEEVGYVNEGLVPVAILDQSTNKALYGYLNLKGDTIIGFRYSWAEHFIDNKAIVRVDPQNGQTESGGYMIIDKSGKNCSSFYSQISQPKDGIYIVTSEGKTAIDSKCKTVIKKQYKDLYYLGAGFFAFHPEGPQRGWAIMNGNEKQLTEPLYKSIILTRSGYFIVQTLKDKAGILDKNGKWIVEPTYDFIGPPEKVN
jgi:hypothetical protein